ncbi:MAG: hypothetical protein GY705_28355 [Bacteroidetes bacterium]|nr:hypothetical protein [Bacteroidota bacterium]
MMQIQNRKRGRIDYSAQAIMRSSRKGALHGVVRDIGIESIYVQADMLFDLDEIVEIEIMMYGYDSQLTIKANASVIRIDQDGIALRFTSQLEWWPLFSLFPNQQIEADQNYALI